MVVQQPGHYRKRNESGGNDHQIAAEVTQVMHQHARLRWLPRAHAGLVRDPGEMASMFASEQKSAVAGWQSSGWEQPGSGKLRS